MDKIKIGDEFISSDGNILTVVGLKTAGKVELYDKANFRFVDKWHKDVLKLKRKDSESDSELLEASLTRLKDHIDNHDVGTITAFRGDKPKAENKENNRQLLAWLRDKGYSVTKIKGSFIENFGTKNERVVSEDSFVVVDIKDTKKLKDDLKKLGEHFDQDSVLFKPKDGQAALVGTSHRDDAYPNYGQEEGLGNISYGAATGQFFSRINGRKFAFESIDDVKDFTTINGRYGNHLLAKKLDDQLKK